MFVSNVSAALIAQTQELPSVPTIFVPHAAVTLLAATNTAPVSAVSLIAILDLVFNVNIAPNAQVPLLLSAITTSVLLAQVTHLVPPNPQLFHIAVAENVSNVKSAMIVLQLLQQFARPRIPVLLALATLLAQENMAPALDIATAGPVFSVRQAPNVQLPQRFVQVTSALSVL